MLAYKKIALLFVLGACFSQTSCLRLFMPQGAEPGPNPEQLLTVVRQYGQGGQSDSASAPQPAMSPSTAPAATLEDEAIYRREISAIFYAGDFGKLEAKVREARASKERLRGGVWKLNQFYDVVATAPAASDGAGKDWPKLFGILKQWKAAQPNSAAAQIAIAEAFVNYGWNIRGDGTADTVSSNRWQNFDVMLGKAASTLVEAAQLKEKCPYWYETMQDVALGQGWTKSQARELFEQAAAFEPTYYHFYREYAYYLLPKWYGQLGETEAFAAEAADRVGGQQGDFIYFELASVTVCSCESDKPSMKNLFWTRIRRGYEVLGQQYGVSDEKANRYALMAYAEDDKASAREAFAIVGNDRGDGVWSSQEHFENTKAWASSQ